MKKLILLSVLLFMVTPVLIFGCSLLPTPSGFEIYIEGCVDGSEEVYYIDVLFEKDETYSDYYYNQINIDHYQAAWYVQDIQLSDLPETYTDFDQEYISMIGYTDYAYNSNRQTCYQGFLNDIVTNENRDNPYMLGDFKIVVSDKDFNILYTSEVYSKTLLPTESDVYHKFVYNPESNTMRAVQEDMFYSTLEDCNIVTPFIKSVLLFFMYVFAIGFIISEVFIYGARQMDFMSRFIVFLLMIPIILLNITSSYITAYGVITSIVVVLAIQGLKYYVIYKRNDGFEDKEIKRLVEIYTIGIIFITVVINVFMHLYK